MDLESLRSAINEYEALNEIKEKRFEHDTDGKIIGKISDLKGKRDELDTGTKELIEQKDAVAQLLKFADEYINTHGHHAGVVVLHPLTTQLEELEKRAKGMPDGVSWCEKLIKSADYHKLCEHTANTLQTLDSADLLSRTKATHSVPLVCYPVPVRYPFLLLINKH